MPHIAEGPGRRIVSWIIIPIPGLKALGLFRQKAKSRMIAFGTIFSCVSRPDGRPGAWTVQIDKLSRTNR
jgi:hypothetical protein